MFNVNTKEIELAQSGSEEALENLVQINSGLVWSIVKRFYGRGYSKEELYQVGAIGLIKAIKRFNTQFDLQFSTYAVPYILGEIKRFIRDDGPIKVSRSIKELASKINEIQRQNINSTGEELSINEVAKKLNVSKEDVAFVLESIRPLESINEEAFQDDSDGESKLSKISNNVDEEKSVIEKITVNKLIGELEERERKIIILRYYREKTQSEVARMLGISQVQVSRIEKKVLLSMRSKVC